MIRYTQEHRVEIHSVSRVYDITKYVETLTLVESTEPPWDSLALELALPLGLIGVFATRDGSEIPPLVPEEGVERTVISGPVTTSGINTSPGLWVKVVDNPSGRCAGFGRINDRPLSHSASGGGTIATTTSLSAIGWFEYLRMLSVEFTPTLRVDVGGLIAMNGPRAARYFRLLQQLIQDPSPTLLEGADGIIGTLTAIQIPSTLFPGKSTLGDLVNVAFSADTGKELCPQRVMDEVPTNASGGLKWVIPSGKVLDLVLSVYQREPRLVELFPSLEAQTNDEMTPGYQNAAPVLIRRWRPWTTGPVSTMAIDSAGMPRLKTSKYDRVTWDLKRGLRLTKGEGYAIQSTRAESNRTNAVTVNWSVAGGSPSRILGLAGAPVFDRTDISLHGVQMMELNWDFTQFKSDESDRYTSYDYKPWFITSDGRARRFGEIGERVRRSEVRQENILEEIRGIMLKGWHFYGLGAVFESGTIEGPFLGVRARAGESVSLDYDGKQGYTAYITRVTHTISMQGGGVKSARTSIGFVRGLWDERARDPHVYLDDDAIAPPEPESINEDEPTFCEMGQPADNFSTLDTSKIPGWVQDWATENRGFHAREFLATNTNRSYVYVCAAVAFIIERYWRQSDPEAQIEVLRCTQADSLEHPDPTGNHVLGAAIDYSIKLSTGRRLGVLQTWATLHCLATAGRIPAGVRGLYLNLNVDGTGVRGVAPEESGVATPWPGSGSRRPSGKLPRGGSGGAHWAIDEAFGRSTGQGERKYLWACTDGTGTDDKKDAIAESYLREMLPAVSKFYDSEGEAAAGESDMPLVGVTIPNVMQVLGQVDSCFTSEGA